MRKGLIVLLALSLCAGAAAQSGVHPKIGLTVSCDELEIRLVGKKQYFNKHDASTLDENIRSPKSVNVSPDGSRFYVNSLEGFKTVIYDTKTFERLAVVDHLIDHSMDSIWTRSPQFFRFRHSYKDTEVFKGKPVEGTFTHGGRFFWVPYYRRSFDLNAQDPSAIAVIDTYTMKICRMIETGVLPKMIRTSPDGKWVAVTHWGDNTVGLINIEGLDPACWTYRKLIEIERKLVLNLSTTTSVDRDSNSGFCLRGTAFTPDNRYLFVGCMGGKGGIAVIDMASKQYLGRLTGMRSNLRHILIRDGYMYLSINNSGYVMRASMEDILAAVAKLGGRGTTVPFTDWVSCKVGVGARTIEMTGDGRYIFAACSYASQLWVVDARTMKPVTSIAVDSYPVGLDVSEDGRYVFVTSQGYRHVGGNAVNIYEVTYK